MSQFLSNPIVASLGTSKNGPEYSLSFAYEFDFSPGDNIQPPGFPAPLTGELLSIIPASYFQNLGTPTFRSMQLGLTFNQSRVTTSQYLNGDYVISNPTTGQVLRIPQPPFLPQQPSNYENGALFLGVVPFILSANSELRIYKTAAGSGELVTNPIITATLFTFDLQPYAISGYTQGDNL